MKRVEEIKNLKTQLDNRDRRYRKGIDQLYKAI